MLFVWTGVGVGVESESSSKERSGPRGLLRGVTEGPRRLAPKFEGLALGLWPYREPVPTLFLAAGPSEGRDPGVARLGTGFAGVLRSGDSGRCKDGLRIEGFRAGLAARAPGPIDWLKFGFGNAGVRPPWLKDAREGVVGVAGPLRMAFSTGRKIPEPGFVVLK
jgi:hypothetical protein